MELEYYIKLLLSNIVPPVFLLVMPQITQPHQLEYPQSLTNSYPQLFLTHQFVITHDHVNTKMQSL